MTPAAPAAARFSGSTGVVEPLTDPVDRSTANPIMPTPRTTTSGDHGWAKG